MKYKAIFLDVDGTTIVHGVGNLPTPRVTQAIRACHKKGISVCLATSRPLSVTKDIIEYLDLFGYCVLSSGAQIYNPLAKQIIMEKSIPREVIPHIIDIAEQNTIPFKLFDGEKEAPYGKVLPEKIMGIYFPEVSRDKEESIMKQLEAILGITPHRMDAWDARFACIDITRTDATKLHGIVEVAKLMGIQTHEMIGVGDGYNDFPLLMACGLKIAMGNAVPELKAIADFIAPSVEEDGVATVIEKFIIAS